MGVRVQTGGETDDKGSSADKAGVFACQNKLSGVEKCAQRWQKLLLRFMHVHVCTFAYVHVCTFTYVHSQACSEPYLLLFDVATSITVSITSSPLRYVNLVFKILHKKLHDWMRL